MMEPVSPEELIGLYFDGRATADERHQAERLLANNATARQWLEQLRQMHATLDALPRQSMPVDCVARVLERAEHVLQRAKPTPVSPSAPLDSLAGRQRRQLWIAISVAAAALAVVVLPNYFAERGPKGDVAFRVQPGEEREASPLVRSDGKDDAYEGASPAADALHMDDVARTSAAPTRGSEIVRKGGGESAKDSGRRLDRSRNLADDFHDAKAPRDPVQFAVSEASTPSTLSYVYNVPTPEAQQEVLRTFEDALRKQQIVLERDTTPESSDVARNKSAAEPLASVPLQRAEGGLGGGVPGAGYAFGLPMVQTRDQAEKSLDCVYVLEATPLQLTNTINTLEALAAQPESGRAARRLPAQQVEQRQASQHLLEERLGQQQGQRPAGEVPSSPPAVNMPQARYGTAMGSNRAQALRFSTEFADAPSLDSAKLGGAAPPAASPALAPAKNLQTPADPRGNQSRMATPAPAATIAGAMAAPIVEQAEAMQRAVIIFRVVPATEPAAEKPRE